MKLGPWDLKNEAQSSRKEYLNISTDVIVGADTSRAASYSLPAFPTYL